jgi:hypothetical protein
VQQSLQGHRQPERLEILVEPQGSVINYLGDPRFKPSAAFKVTKTTEDMDQHRRWISNHIIRIIEEAPMGVQSKDEVKDIIFHHFGICKHAFYVYHSYLKPFISIFPNCHDRDVIFAASRAIEGPIELSFHSWDLDRFGVRERLPYHVKLSLKGIPQHAWTKEVADVVLCDEAIIHHVNEETVDRIDQRSFNYWTFSKDPSRIPNKSFLLSPSMNQTWLQKPRFISIDPGRLNTGMSSGYWCTLMQLKICSFTTILEKT